jgi:mRNA interferase MazF
MFNSGDVILANIQFVDSIGIKKRPAVVLYSELGNFVVAGITSNLKMKGIVLTEKEGAIKKSIIKTNYIFTIGNELIEKKLFSLTKSKKKILYDELNDKISNLNN